MLMEGGQVAGMRKHPYGRVDQLEDRYLGMVEAPSSNLGTSTLNDFSPNLSGSCASTKLNPVGLPYRHLADIATVVFNT